MSTFRKTYRPLTAFEAGVIDSIKSTAEVLEGYIAQLTPSREQSLACTKLEEAVMWAVKGITG